MLIANRSNSRRHLVSLFLVVVLMLGMIFFTAPDAEACGCGTESHWWPPTGATHTYITHYDDQGGHYHLWLHTGPGGTGTYHELCGCSGNCPTGPIQDPLE